MNKRSNPNRSVFLIPRYAFPFFIASGIICQLSAPCYAAHPNSNLLDKLDKECAPGQMTEEKIAQIDGYIKEHPNDPKARLIAGRLFDAAGMESLAKEQFHIADSLDPNFLINEFHDRLAKNQPITRLFLYLRSDFSNEPSILYVDGYTKIEEHDLAGAIKSLEFAMSSAVPWPGTAALLSEAYFKQGNLKDALKYAEIEIRQNPFNSAARKIEILAAIKQGTPPERFLQDLKALARTYPNDRNVNLYLAQALRANNDFTSALIPSLLCITTGQNKDEINEATNLCREILQKTPTSTVDRAIAQLGPTSGKNNMMAILYLRLADIYSSLNQHQAAIKQLRMALSLTTVFAARIDYRIAQEYIALNNDELAVSYAARAHELRPNDAEITNSLMRWNALTLCKGNDIARRIKSWLRAKAGS